LLLGISPSDLRPWFAETKAKLPEQTLALPHAQVDTPSLLDELSQRLAIPQIASQTEIPGRLSQGGIDFRKLALTQPPRTSRTFPLHQPSESLLFESVHPAGNGSGRIAQQFRNMATAHPLSHQQHPV
jgi:hypothetical protein